MARQAHAVLPSRAVSDPRADAHLIMITLRPELDEPGVVAWLRRLTDLVRSAEGDPHRPTASVVDAFGRSFFQRADGTPRFGQGDRVPTGLLPGLVVPGASPIEADILLYVMSPTEAVIADLLRGIAATRAGVIAAVEIERGFARDDRRELFGFLDGLRNMPRSARRSGIFINRDREAEEPRWAEDGTYLAYLKIEQNLDAWNALSAEDQEQIMGRRKADGSRLDLPTGTNPHAEPDQIGEPPLGRSHIRKTGSNLPVHAGLGLFRRGVPYFSLRPDGSPDGGLHFVSFQRSFDRFDLVLNRWLGNPDFPAPAAGLDRLFVEGFATIRRSGFYFVPPDDARFIAAGLFDPAVMPGHGRRPGRILVRKRVVTQAGSASPAERGGVGFRILRSDTLEPIGDIFTTDGDGRATSPEVPLGTNVILREEIVPAHLEPADPVEQTITVSQRSVVVIVTNRARSGGYGT
jgi:deferrochelatase/peroxidase EfeB